MNDHSGKYPGTMELLSDPDARRILYTDEGGNHFRFLSKDGQTILARAGIRTPVVHIPAVVKDEAGTEYPLTAIGSTAFYEEQELKHLVIPEGVMMLEGNLFTNCGSLLSVRFPASLRKMGPVFRKCPTVECNEGGLIYYPGTPQQWDALLESDPVRWAADNTPYHEVVRFIDPAAPFQVPDMDFQTLYDEESDEDISLVRVCEMGGEVTIPVSYTDENGVQRGITQIGRSSFAGNQNVRKVIIPSTIQRIGNDAFYNCKNLQEVVIEKAGGELDIGMGAFFSCEHLEVIRVGRECRWDKFTLEKTPARLIPLP